ncbi:MAG: peptide chain release factor 1 [SAR86 cluster bacterium]|jgi:peptide chain release factor 1|uniref:Peptide chain release factor 1 n=1 Tax=SAR86 cluster bacterium TaxID=2030880 RepID=A0A368BN13_9GAMM|nr:MAG: peptide chain release factor 1 [Gammaproteobacteria bacterium TMED219]RCL38709.1 MAG: peptide chain release factor 1 [SAR86 cluster bacterium]|tara:strand:- start:11275 stop:12354 length:1080 start_codon:yes stop_codon:yes gene_type:complete
MKANIRKSLENIKLKANELSDMLSDPSITSDIDQLTKLNKEFSEVKDIVNNWDEYLELEKNLVDLEELLKDDEMKELASEEKKDNELKLQALEAQIMIQLLPKDKDDKRNAFLELRAGAGGDEAAIFVGDLYRMYVRFSERSNWKLEKVKEIDSGPGGFKEVVIRVIGNEVYGDLKFESGVHRVQRVPLTESQGRIHTSTATVAVLPEMDDIEEKDVDMSEIRVDTFRASGAGGQHVNKTDSAVRLTHIPTGIVVECQDDRSQHKNKAKALALLSSKIYDIEKQKAEQEKASERKSLVGTGDRSEKIRTYNFPQGRITDHRIKLTQYNIEGFLDGDINEMVESLKAQNNAEKLSEIENQ